MIKIHSFKSAHQPKFNSAYRAIFILVALLYTCSCQTKLTEHQVPFKADREYIDRAIHRFMQKYNVPGLSIAMAKHGKIFFVQGYGKADISSSARVTPHHRFRIGSISKPITSVAILKLIEQNKLSLKDYVFGPEGILGRDYRTDNQYIRSVTIQHLLEHTAGREWSSLEPDPMFLTPEKNHKELIQWVISSRPLKNPPGTSYNYSNFGFCVLGRVIEKITDEPYSRYIQKLLKPYEINSFKIALNQPSKDGTEVHYYPQDKGLPYALPISRTDSHGGWTATAEDLVRLLLRIDGRTPPEDMISKETVARMTKPSVQNQNYALGWHVNKFNNWWHAGLLPGTTGLIVRTGHGMCWALLLNTSTSDPAFLTDLDRLPWDIINNIKE